MRRFIASLVSLSLLGATLVLGQTVNPTNGQGDIVCFKQDGSMASCSVHKASFGYANIPFGMAYAIGGVKVLGGLSLVPLGGPYSAAGTPLPAASAANKGSMAYVTDATSPTYNGTYTSGGAVVVPVFSTGAAWLTH